jgi:hypothetical protein
MHFKIKTQDSEITLTLHDLFVQILNQAFEDFNEDGKKIDTDTFIQQINSILLTTENMILDSTGKQIYSIYFLAGYYYKIFMTKNNVTIEKE